jgi:hypothetical protein
MLFREGFMKQIFALICLLTNCFTVFTYAKDGNSGANGGTGSDGSNGTSTVNFIPTNATASYPLYLPILNCDPEGVRSALKAGAKVNFPIYHSRKSTPISVALKHGCVTVLNTMIENPDQNNKPNFEAIMFDYEGNSFNFYRELLLFGNQPNIAVRNNALNKLKLILPTLNDAELLAEMTLDIVKNLVSSENRYARHSNNVEAVNVIQNRLKELAFRE